MTIDIRPAKQTEMTDFVQTARRSLTLPAHVAPPEALAAIRPEWTLCAFENGELNTSYAWWPLTMRFAGAECPVAGITFVGTRPAFRRKGHLRGIVSRHFQIMHENGQQPVAALHASRTAIYQRYGYAVVSWRKTYCVDPRDLVFARGRQDSSHQAVFREIESDQWDVLKDVYKKFCKDRIGYLHRSAGFWENGVLAPPPRDGVLSRIVWQEDEIPKGYVIYTVEPVKDKRGRFYQKVIIRDLAWLTPGAFQALWGHFAAMDLAENIRWMYVPPDDPLPYIVNEPAALNMEIRDGFMARIVDVPGALARRLYSADGRICFEIKDDLCHWNRGTWQMEVSKGCAEIARTTRTPELCMSIDVLAMLFFGHLQPGRAAQTGLLQALLPEALPLWNRMLQTPYLPFCPDFF